MKNIIIVLMLFCAIIYGCKKEPLDFEKRNPNIVVIDGWITTEPTVHEIFLTTTGTYGEGASNPVENALVLITTPNGDVELLHEGEGYYKTPQEFALDEFEEYVFTIDIDEETYEYATFTDLEPDIIAFEYSDYVPEQKIEFTLENDDGKERFYILKWYEGKEVGNDTLWTPLEGNFEEMKYFSINFAQDTVVRLEFSASKIAELPLGTVVRLEIHSITGETFEYIHSLFGENSPANLFDPADSNPGTMFSNGAFGTVITSAVSYVDFEKF